MASKQPAIEESPPRSHPEYEALGIFPDTWACISVLDESSARQYVFDLIASGVDCRVAKDPDGKRYHIATQGGLASSPMAWIITIRGREESDVPVCQVSTGQHPQVERTS